MQGGPVILQVSSLLADARVNDVREQLEARGVRTMLFRGGEHSFIRCIGDPTVCRDIARAHSIAFTGSEEATPLVARVTADHRTVVRVGAQAATVIGGPTCAVIAGPCAVEGRDVLLETARGVRAGGAGLLRGGAFKPRSSPYTFQGMGDAGLDLLEEARRETGLPIVTEVMDPRQVDRVAEVADVLQVGARNMQNYPLLDELGRLPRPVLLKRGLAATVAEWLFAAERILAAGNPNVILCERGIRTYETVTRNTLDVGAVAAVRHMTHLPVIVDPSHAAGRRELVIPLALAAVAAGADGLIVEVHPRPAEALSDGQQSLDLLQFSELMRSVSAVAQAVGRSVWRQDHLAQEVAA
jgi:3-deoxy-7-phosphoheptulonate synthase